MDCCRVKSIFSLIFCSTPRIEHRNFVVFNDPYPVKPLTHLTFLSFSCERPDPVHRGEGATTTFHILVRDLVKAEIQPDVHIILVVVIFIIFVIIVIIQVIVTQVIRLSAQQVRIVKNLLLLYSLAWQLCKIYNHLLMFLCARMPLSVVCVMFLFARVCRWVLMFCVWQVAGGEPPALPAQYQPDARLPAGGVQLGRVATGASGTSPVKVELMSALRNVCATSCLSKSVKCRPTNHTVNWVQGLMFVILLGVFI